MNNTELPTTAAELESLAKQYIRSVIGGGIAPIRMSHEEMGARFREAAEDAPAEINQIASFVAGTSGNDAELGRHMHEMYACASFEQQVRQHQQDQRISALVTSTFDFSPLDFTVDTLRLGLWLEPLGDDAARLKANAIEVTQKVQRLAAGRGNGWIRCREVDFKLDDGTWAWRYSRDDWGGLEQALEQATHATVRGCISEIEGSKGQAVELTLWTEGSWPGCEDGETTSWLLVHPELAAELAKPETWWC